MKPSFFLLALIVLGYGRQANGNDAFECPAKCSPNAYRPVCLRGKSYANLCVLKQEICKGSIARELYKDVEACPGYEKYDDANGASVEAIDKNGVIFRTLIDAPEEIVSSSEAANNVPVAKSVDRSTKTRGSRRRVAGRRNERLERKRKTHRRRICVLRVPSLCPIKFLGCRCYTPILLEEGGRYSSSESTGTREEVGPLLHIWLKKYDLSEMTSASKDPKHRRLLAPTLEKLRINCDPNE